MKIKRYYGAGLALFRLNGQNYQIFLGKRSIKQGFGKWSIPGGGYEQSDFSYLNCANREFKEELGRYVPDGEVLGIKSFNYPFFHWKTFIMFTDDNMTDCCLSEFSEAKWINIKDVENYELCFGVKAEIKKFLKLEKTNKQAIVEVICKADEQLIKAAQKEQKQTNEKITAAHLQRTLGISHNHAVRTVNLLRELEQTKTN